jgi:hypothetical protein
MFSLYRTCKNKQGQDIMPFIASFVIKKDAEWYAETKSEEGGYIIRERETGMIWRIGNLTNGGAQALPVTKK